MTTEQVYIKTDIDRLENPHIAYFRMDKQMREFLQKCIDKHNNIDAIFVELEDGKVDYNIGFALNKTD